MNDTYAIEELIENHEFKVKHTWHEWYYGDVPKDVEIPGLGIVNVEKTGGYDENEASFVILRVERPNGVTRYFKKSGYSSSYGLDFNGQFTEVFPQERVIKEFK